MKVVLLEDVRKLNEKRKDETKLWQGEDQE